MPPARLVAAALAAALALAFGVAGCSGGGDGDAGGDPTSTSAPEATLRVDLEVVAADLVSPHAALGPLDAGTRDDVAGVVERLLLVTSARPLSVGTAGAGFADLFTADAGARAANADRDVFFDEGVPRFGALDPEEATIRLTALAGSIDPAPALVVAKFRWDVTSAENRRDRVVREGELQLVPVEGGWKVAAYTIVVTRTVAGTATTTTATTATTARAATSR